MHQSRIAGVEMSRAPHEPTNETRQYARSLSALGQSQEDIAVIVGVSEKTLRKHYASELQEGAAEANAAVVGFLMDKIKEGNVAAMIFFDKAQGGKRETIREEVFGSGSGAIKMGANGGILPCNGIGPCPRLIADYKSGDEDLEPKGITNDELSKKFEEIMAKHGRKS